MNAALDPVMAIFDRLMPAPTAEDRAELARLERVEAATQQHEAFVAARAPELARMYQRDPRRAAAAFGDVDLTQAPALLAALLERDAAALGRLLLAEVDAILRERAEDDAEEQGYRMFPEAL